MLPNLWRSFEQPVDLFALIGGDSDMMSAIRAQAALMPMILKFGVFN